MVIVRRHERKRCIIVVIRTQYPDRALIIQIGKRLHSSHIHAIDLRSMDRILLHALPMQVEVKLHTPQLRVKSLPHVPIIGHLSELPLSPVRVFHRCDHSAYTLAGYRRNYRIILHQERQLSPVLRQ